MNSAKQDQKYKVNFILFLLFFIHWVGCSTGQNSHQETRLNIPDVMNRPYVVLISIDGYRYDYTDRYSATNLKKMRSEGVAAEGLLPVFPSKTFTNHYSIATGLYAENHGIVANFFYDPVRNEEYRLSDPSKVRDGTWYRGEPIWVSAEKQGMLAATYFWPGSEAAIQGIRPSYFYEYDEKRSFSDRIQQVKSWLELPAEQRPHFITLYFSDVDTAGHRHGPDSKAVGEAVTQVDQAIGFLRQTLAQFPYDIYTIVLSDHGMQSLDNQKVEYLNQYIDLKEVKIAGEGPISLIYVKKVSAIEKIYSQLKASARHFQVYKRSELPESLHYKRSDRVGDIVLVAEAPYSIAISQENFKITSGNHGYDPDTTQNMTGIFYAQGPQLKSHLKIKKFRNIQVYPFITHLLKLKIKSAIDGDDDLSDQILQESFYNTK